MNSHKNDLNSLKGLRLLFFATYPPPYGGISSHLKTLMPSLLKSGAKDITVVSISDKNCVEKVDGITVYRYNIKWNLWRIFMPQNLNVVRLVFRSLGGEGLSLSKLLVELVKTILTNQIAIAHRSQVISSYIADESFHLIPLEKLWQGKIGIVLTVFGCLYEHWEFMSSHQNLVHKVLALPKFVLSSSQHCADSFKKIGNTRKIEVVYVGVELEGVISQDDRERFRSQHEIKKNDVIVFFMGRMIKDMGFDVVIQTAPTLLKSVPYVKLLIAGATGALTKQALALMSKYPDRVIVLENVSFNEQRQLYSAADILVAPSFNQRACMGVSIKEAMSACLPVVGGAGGGVPEAVIDGETGYLIPVGLTGDVDGTAYMEGVLRLVREPELRSRLGKAGRQRVEKLFSVEKTNTRMMEIFLSASVDS